MYFLTGAEIWSVIAHFGAAINLFNLIPVWQLDGARGLHSLNTMQRRIVLGVAATLWLITSESMLLLVTLGLGYRQFTKDAADEPDQHALVQYASLLVILAAVLVLAKLR